MLTFVVTLATWSDGAVVADRPRSCSNASSVTEAAGSLPIEGIEIVGGAVHVAAACVQDAAREPLCGIGRCCLVPAFLNGSPVGIKVFFREGGFLSAVGLNSGDIIEAAGSVRMMSADAILRVQSRLQTDPPARLDLAIRRKGVELRGPIFIDRVSSRCEAFHRGTIP
jgi:hypothetical protein